jgi:hypothetical protein
MDAWKDDIEKYINGKLTLAERHALEKKALSDPFLADALEGAEIAAAETFAADVNDLNQKILGQGKNRWLWPLRIAASVIGVAVISTIVIYSTSDTTENLASNKEQKTQAPAVQKNDSLNQASAESGDSDANESKPTEAEQKKSENLIAAIKDTKPQGKENKASKSVPLLAEKEVTSTPTSAGAGGVQSSQPTTPQSSTAGPGILSDTISATGLASTTTPIVDMILSAEERSSDDVALPVAQPKLAREESRMKRASGTALNTFEVSGIVRDQQGEPIPGVNIIAKGSAIGTTTDGEGRYSLNLTDMNQSLVYSFIGYQPQEQPITESKKDKLDVNLEEDATQLSEVVVTGYGQRDNAGEPVVRLAEPMGGRKAYNQYLEDKKLYPQQALDNKVEGKVVIEFTVGITGVLSDFNVIRKIGFGCEEELIRLVKEGPKWRPSYIDNEAVESLVRVKTKFDLPGKK